ncbi:hypothetical protein ACFX1Q_021223 [Malus domestica]
MVKIEALAQTSRITRVALQIKQKRNQQRMMVLKIWEDSENFNKTRGLQCSSQMISVGWFIFGRSDNFMSLCSA